MIISAKHLKGTLHSARWIHGFYQRHEPSLHSTAKPQLCSSANSKTCMRAFSTDTSNVYVIPPIAMITSSLSADSCRCCALDNSFSCCFSFFTDETSGMERSLKFLSSSQILRVFGENTYRWMSTVFSLKALSKKGYHLMG